MKKKKWVNESIKIGNFLTINLYVWRVIMPRNFGIDYNILYAVERIFFIICTILMPFFFFYFRSYLDEHREKYVYVYYSTR